MLTALNIQFIPQNPTPSTPYTAPPQVFAANAPPKTPAPSEPVAQKKPKRVATPHPNKSNGKTSKQPALEATPNKRKAKTISKSDVRIHLIDPVTQIVEIRNEGNLPQDMTGNYFCSWVQRLIN